MGEDEDDPLIDQISGIVDHEVIDLTMDSEDPEEAEPEAARVDGEAPVSRSKSMPSAHSSMPSLVTAISAPASSPERDSQPSPDARQKVYDPRGKTLLDELVRRYMEELAEPLKPVPTRERTGFSVLTGQRADSLSSAVKLMKQTLFLASCLRKGCRNNNSSALKHLLFMDSNSSRVLNFFS